MSTIYAAKLEPYDVAAGSALALYYATGTFNSGGSDTPAHTHFADALEQPLDIMRAMFAPNTTRGRSQVSRGKLVLNNLNGALDAFARYAFDGRAVTVYRGEDTAAFPAGFTVIFKGTMADADLTRDFVTIRVRDNQEVLDQRYQVTKFAGTNALPAGLEGVSDIAGKPKPIALGKVRNVPAVLVNTSKNIYEVNDGAITLTDMVFDDGVAIIPQGAFTSRTIPSGFDTAPKAVAWAEEQSQFVLIGAGSGADECATSPDGITWTNRTLADTTEGWFDVAYGAADDLFVVVGGTSTPFLYSSPDGITWSVRTSNFAGTSIRGVASGGGKWVAVGNSGDVSISDDGITWVAASTPPGGALILNDAIYVFGQWYCCTDTEEIYESTDDGDTWALLYNGPVGNDPIKALAFGNNILVGIGNAGYVATSVDGITFEERTIPGITGNITDIDFGFGYFLACGASGLTATSPDGINWTTHEVGTTSHNCIAFGSTTYGTWVLGATLLYSSTGAGSDFSSEADMLLESSKPLPGQFKTYLAGGQFRLGSPASGQITADVTVEASDSDRTAGQLWTDVLVRAGFSSGDWVAADVTALDADNAIPCGHWTGLQETTFSAVLSALAESVGAWWGVDKDGKYRIQVLKDPQLETNEFTFPRTLDNAAWTKTRSSITADDAVAPNGVIDLDLIVEDATASATHEMSRDIAGSIANDEIVVMSFIAKAASRTELRCSITGKDATVNSGFVNLSTGAIGTLSGATLRVVAYRGAYRVFITADVATGGTTPSFAIHLSSGSETISYNGDNTSGLHVWDIKRQKDVALTIVATDMVVPLERLPAALPTFKTTVRYQKNHTVQDTGLAGAVTDVRRGVLLNEFLESASTDAVVQTPYLLAAEKTYETLMDTAAGAATEAARLQPLRGVRRERYSMAIPLDDDSEGLDLGQYVDVIHDRFELDPGKEFVVMQVKPNATSETLALEVWG